MERLYDIRLYTAMAISNRRTIEGEEGGASELLLSFMSFSRCLLFFFLTALWGPYRESARNKKGGYLSYHRKTNTNAKTQHQRQRGTCLQTNTNLENNTQHTLSTQKLYTFFITK